jgi:two-component system response regulator WspF
MKIAIVNDMVIAIEALRRVLLTVADYQVIWIAKNGAEAVTKCAENTPDLILMDLLMPVMDGVEATRLIIQKSPCAILVVTADVKQNAAKVFEAMGYGALDAVNTPILGTYGNPTSTQTLLRKIATIEKLIRKSSHPSLLTPLSSSLSPYPVSLPPLIIIGASTGGPKALEQGISLYRDRAFTDAKAHFDRVLAVHSSDQAAKLYLDRIESLLSQGISTQWHEAWTF